MTQLPETPVACPYFMPTAKFEAIAQPHRARLPLGDGWQGHCTAPGHEGFVPGPEDLANLCNLGYARSCSHLPQERDWDAVRFSVARDKGNLVTVLYVCERDYRPADHGTLDYDWAIGRWRAMHPDPRIQKMAGCYLECYLLRRDQPVLESNIPS
ncbi:MAG TPA: hypothetical protein VL155_19690 [Terriglobales bacterium]|jgi:hypothetical protein|nr:hypothetical protein [Terriglobales bacterium]